MTTAIELKALIAVTKKLPEKFTDKQYESARYSSGSLELAAPHFARAAWYFKAELVGYRYYYSLNREAIQRHVAYLRQQVKEMMLLDY